MVNPFQPFLSRFDHFKDILAPLDKAPHVELETVYKHVGVGWFKDFLIQILDPIYIIEITPILSKLKKLENKIPFAVNAFGDLFFLNPDNGQIEFYNFFNNQMTKMADSLPKLLNETLYNLNYHSSLKASEAQQLIKSLGKLTINEIFQPQTPILLGGESKSNLFKRSLLLPFLSEIISIIQQLETLSIKNPY